MNGKKDGERVISGDVAPLRSVHGEPVGSASSMIRKAVSGKPKNVQSVMDALAQHLVQPRGRLSKPRGEEFGEGGAYYALGVAVQMISEHSKREDVLELWEAAKDQFADDPAGLDLLREVEDVAGLNPHEVIPVEFGGPPPPLRLPTLKDLQAVIGATRYLWDGYIMAGGLTLIGSSPGAGKTCFAADLHRRWWRGLTWPDGTPIEAREEDRRRPVLYLMADRRPTQLSEVYQAMGLPADAVRLLAESDKPTSPLLLDEAGIFDTIRRAVEEYHPAWILIDTLTSALGGIDSLDPKRLNGPIGQLQDIAVTCDVPVIALAHLSSSGHAYGRQVEKYAEHFFTLTLSDPADPRSPRNLKARRSRRLESTRDLGVHYSPDGWEYGEPHEEVEQGGKPPKGAKTENDVSAVALVLDKAGRSGVVLKELSDALATDDRSGQAAQKAAQRALDRLRENGTAVNSGGRWYKAGNEPYDDPPRADERHGHGV
jgi:hypothetical protein